MDRALGSLLRAATDALETEDYLSYATVLDIFLGEPSHYTYPEREILLGSLLKTLGGDKKLIHAVGWDLPALLVPYIDSDYDFSGAIRLAPCVYRVMKLFEALAHYGNPKELFLKCTELLSSLRVDECGVAGTSSDNKEKFFDIKLYCLFELIDSCMKRVTTVYPLRFLLMTVLAFANMLYATNVRTNSATLFLLKRVYSFARNYTSPELPENTGLSPEDLQKAKEDEDYLQRKLLTGFVTSLVALVGRNYALGYSVYLVDFIKQQYDPVKADGVGIPVLDRLHTLLLSYDIDPQEVFGKYISDAHALFDSCDYTLPQDELNARIFEKVLVDYQQNTSYIVSSDAQSIRDSPDGVMRLFTHYIVAQLVLDYKISFSDALMMTLRLVIPSMVRPTFGTKTQQDVVVFWAWYALHQLLEGPQTELELLKVPRILLSIYYQALLFILVANPSEHNFRYVTLTLLTRVLALSPQEVAYDFIKDLLANCPYDNVKAVLISVFKELLTKDKRLDLAQDLESVLLSEKKEKDEKAPSEVSSAPPPLPPRDVPETTKYIALTPQKTADLVGLVKAAIDDAYITEDSVIIRLDLVKLTVLSAYLNLLVVLKQDPVVKASWDKFEAIVKDVRSKNAEFLATIKTDDSRKVELNSVGVLNITLDRIEQR